MTSKRKISDPSGQPSTKRSKSKAGDSDLQYKDSKRFCVNNEDLETEKVTSVWSFSEEQDESLPGERKKECHKEKEVFIEKSIELKNKETVELFSDIISRRIVGEVTVDLERNKQEEMIWICDKYEKKQSLHNGRIKFSVRNLTKKTIYINAGTEIGKIYYSSETKLMSKQQKTTDGDPSFEKYISSFKEMYQRRKKAFTFEKIQDHINDMKRFLKEGPEELLQLLRKSKREITHCLEILRYTYPLINDAKIDSIEDIVQVIIFMLAQEDENIKDSSKLVKEEENVAERHIGKKESTSKLRLKTMSELFDNPNTSICEENICKGEIQVTAKGEKDEKTINIQAKTMELSTVSELGPVSPPPSAISHLTLLTHLPIYTQETTYENTSFEESNNEKVPQLLNQDKMVKKKKKKRKKKQSDVKRKSVKLHVDENAKKSEAWHDTTTKISTEKTTNCKRYENQEICRIDASPNLSIACNINKINGLHSGIVISKKNHRTALISCSNKCANCANGLKVVLLEDSLDARVKIHEKILFRFRNQMTIIEDVKYQYVVTDIRKLAVFPTEDAATHVTSPSESQQHQHNSQNKNTKGEKKLENVRSVQKKHTKEHLDIGSFHLGIIAQKENDKTIIESTNIKILEGNTNSNEKLKVVLLKDSMENGVNLKEEVLFLLSNQNIIINSFKYQYVATQVYTLNAWGGNKNHISAFISNIDGKEYTLVYVENKILCITKMHHFSIIKEQRYKEVQIGENVKVIVRPTRSAKCPLRVILGCFPKHQNEFSPLLGCICHLSLKNICPHCKSLQMFKAITFDEKRKQSDEWLCSKKEKPKHCQEMLNQTDSDLSYKDNEKRLEIDEEELNYYNINQKLRSQCLIKFNENLLSVNAQEKELNSNIQKDTENSNHTEERESNKKAKQTEKGKHNVDQERCCIILAHISVGKNEDDPPISKLVIKELTEGDNEVSEYSSTENVENVSDFLMKVYQKYGSETKIFMTSPSSGKFLPVLFATLITERKLTVEEVSHMFSVGVFWPMAFVFDENKEGRHQVNQMSNILLEALDDDNNFEQLLSRYFQAINSLNLKRDLGKISSENQEKIIKEKKNIVEAKIETEKKKTASFTNNTDGKKIGQTFGELNCGKLVKQRRETAEQTTVSVSNGASSDSGRKVILIDTDDQETEQIIKRSSLESACKFITPYALESFKEGYSFCFDKLLLNRCDAGDECSFIHSFPEHMDTHYCYQNLFKNCKRKNCPRTHKTTAQLKKCFLRQFEDLLLNCDQCKPISDLREVLRSRRINRFQD